MGDVSDWTSLGAGGERMFRWSTTPIWDYLFRLRTYGRENVPAAGPFLICPNHSSYIDPFVQARGQRRRMRFMAKSQLFEIPVLRTLVRAGGGFPVRRGEGDAFAVEVARAILESGEPVCLYPEGTRYRASDALGPPRRGAARLALEMGMPVLPVATYGTKPRRARGQRGLGLPKVTTIYGPLMQWPGLEPTPENVEFVRDEIWREVHRLYDLARDVTQARRRPRQMTVPPRRTAR